MVIIQDGLVSRYQNNNNNNNNPRTILIVLSSWPLKVIARVHSVHLMNTAQRTSGCRPSYQANWLGLWACRQLSSTTTIAIYYYYSARKLILIYRPTEGRRLRMSTFWILLELWMTSVLLTTGDLRGGGDPRPNLERVKLLSVSMKRHISALDPAIGSSRHFYRPLTIAGRRITSHC